MYKIKNWDEFQHFKDRNPPWIKLYKTILERRDIAMISDCNFRVLVGFWLLASEDPTHQGILPSISDMAFRLRKTEEEITKSIHDLVDFLIAPDIGAISPRYQGDINAISLARSQETETETETEKARAKKISSLSELEKHPLNGPHQAWFEENCPQVDRYSIREELVLYCRSKGKSYKDYWATMQTWGRRKQGEIPKPKAPKKQAEGMKEWIENV